MSYTYPKSYKVKTPIEQIEIIRKAFGLKLNLWRDAENTSEGLFAIPHWKLLGETYNAAVVKVMDVLKASRETYDYRGGNWGESYLKQLPVKEQFWKSQKEEVVLISAQFGQKHAGRSVQSVRDSLESNELPFGIYEVLIMLLTHPERLQESNDLWINCPGDEYTVGSFSEVPYVRFNDGKVKFGTRDVSNAYGDFGSVSGFVPQPLDTRSLESVESFSLERAIEICKENGLVVYQPK